MKRNFSATKEKSVSFSVALDSRNTEFTHKSSYKDLNYNKSYKDLSPNKIIDKFLFKSSKKEENASDFDKLKFEKDIYCSNFFNK